MKNGHIYIGEYAGWYCLADEAFVPESQLQTLPDGTKSTLEGNKPVELVQEPNYKFRLSSFKEELLEWLKGGKAPQILNFIPTEEIGTGIITGKEIN